MTTTEASAPTPASPKSSQHLTTLSDDGTRLSTRIIGPANPAATVIFAHGYCLRSSTWTRTIRALTRQHPTIRFISFDQRGHGSSSLPPGPATIEQLGSDLEHVINGHAVGEVVTVGHSMGGMGLFAHARLFPRTVAERIIGTILISTAPRGLAHCGIGAPYNIVPLGLARAALALSPRRAQLIKGRGVQMLSPALHAAQGHTIRRDFRPTDCVGPSVATIAAFLKSLTYHDQRAALPIIAQIRSSVICGDCDIATPLRHNMSLADTVGAELKVLPGAGHLAYLEHPNAMIDSVTEMITATGIG